MDVVSSATAARTSAYTVCFGRHIPLCLRHQRRLQVVQIGGPPIRAEPTAAAASSVERTRPPRSACRRRLPFNRLIVSFRSCPFRARHPPLVMAADHRQPALVLCPTCSFPPQPVSMHPCAALVYFRVYLWRRDAIREALVNVPQTHPGTWQPQCDSCCFAFGSSAASRLLLGFRAALMCACVCALFCVCFCRAS